jgi:hypothetical protein
MSDVKLVFTGDGTELRADIDSDIKALQKFASVVDTSNATAVRAFRESAVAQRQLMQELGATDLQMATLDATTRKFEASVQRATEKASRIDQISPKARTGASALTMLAYSAAGAGGSTQGATIAAGTLADTVASLSKNARAAAAASGIGALATMLGTLITLAIEAKKALKEIPEGVLTDMQKKHIEDLKSVAAVERDLAIARQRAVALRDATGKHDQDALQASVNANAKVEALTAKLLELKHAQLGQERDIAEAQAAGAKSAEERYRAQVRLIELQRQIAIRDNNTPPSVANAVAARSTENLLRPAIEKAYQLRNEAVLAFSQLGNDIDAKRKAILIGYEQEKRALDEMTLTEAKREDILDAIEDKRRAALALLEKQQALVNATAKAQLAAGSDDFITSYQGRLALIEQEKQAQIKAGVEVATAEAVSLQQRAALRKEIMQGTISDLQTIEDATSKSASAQTRAIGSAAKTIRKLEIGAEGAKAAVKSVHEAAEAIASAAHGDFAGAALHGAASIKFAAAAALAAKESLGGGGGGGGGGGASAGGSTANAQRESSRLGASLGSARGQDTIKIEFVYVQKDQSGREVARTRQMIDRLEQRNQPIRMGL